MQLMRQKQSKEKIKKKQPIKVNNNGKVEKLGWLLVDSKVAELTLDSSEQKHFKDGKWAMYKVLVTQMARINADIIIKDKDTKWKFKIASKDFLFYAEEVGNTLLCATNHFEVLKASKWTTVISCYDSSCPHNLANHCLKGSIEITKEGKCKWL